MGLSRKAKEQLQKEYFKEIKINNKDAWNLCYICRKPRYEFVPVENIPMPVCKDHRI